MKEIEEIQQRIESLNSASTILAEDIQVINQKIKDLRTLLQTNKSTRLKNAVSLEPIYIPTYLNNNNQKQIGSSIFLQLLGGFISNREDKIEKKKLEASMTRVNNELKKLKHDING